MKFSTEIRHVKTQVMGTVGGHTLAGYTPDPSDRARLGKPMGVAWDHGERGREDLENVLTVTYLYVIHAGPRMTDNRLTASYAIVMSAIPLNMATRTNLTQNAGTPVGGQVILPSSAVFHSVGRRHTFRIYLSASLSLPAPCL